MKTITKKFLKKHDACSDGYKWFCKNCLDLPVVEQLEKLLSHRGEWANWLITRTLSLDNVAKYAKFAADVAAEYAKFAADAAAAAEYAVDAAEYAEQHTVGAVEYAEHAVAVVAEYAAGHAGYTEYTAATVCAAECAGYAEYAAAYTVKAGYTAREDVYKKIVGYGLELLKEELKNED